MSLNMHIIISLIARCNSDESEASFLQDHYCPQPPSACAPLLSSS